MSADREAYDALAAVFLYPGKDRGKRSHVTLARECAVLLDSRSAEAAAQVRGFVEEIAQHTPEDLEELYARTFDFDPACCLDLGWHLYGEAYERGRFLVSLRGLLREHGIEEGGELPDHVSHLLRLVGRMEPEQATLLCREKINPALAKVNGALEKSGNPYRHVVTATRALISQRVGHDVPEVSHE